MFEVRCGCCCGRVFLRYCRCSFHLTFAILPCNVCNMFAMWQDHRGRVCNITHRAFVVMHLVMLLNFLLIVSSPVGRLRACSIGGLARKAEKMTCNNASVSVSICSVTNIWARMLCSQHFPPPAATAVVLMACIGANALFGGYEVHLFSSKLISLL